jgi:hypothetical protein
MAGETHIIKDKVHGGHKETGSNDEEDIGNIFYGSPFDNRSNFAWWQARFHEDHNQAKTRDIDEAQHSYLRQLISKVDEIENKLHTVQPNPILGSNCRTMTG